MTEEATETPPEEIAPPAEPAEQGNPEDALGDAGKQALDRMKAERNEANRRLKAMERELEKQRQASMSEAERAVAEAEQRGRMAAVQEYGKRLALTEFQRLAAQRNSTFDASGALEYIDQSRFLSEDGEPDAKAIAAAVERFVPEASVGTAQPSFDGGARTAAKPTNMNDVIRQAAGLR